MLIVFLALAVVSIVFLLRRKKTVKEFAVVDSSVLMDGRICDIVSTKFLSLDLIIPSFVVDELKHISESLDKVQRSRSQRALSIVDKLQKSDVVNIKIVKLNLNESSEVSVRIIDFAKNARAKIITKNFDLYKKASLYGVEVLNINDLEAALYPLFLPGEKMRVHLVKDSAQQYQAIGYFDDKTIIVAEDGKNFIGKNVILTITSAMFTSTGKIIFGKILG
jgi:uncharacterized protein YacL